MSATAKPFGPAGARGVDLAGINPSGIAGVHPGSALREARERESAGGLTEAAAIYQVAIEAALESGEHAARAEALRRLGVVRHRLHDDATARELCASSHDAAAAVGDDVLAAQALNALAIFDMEAGACDAARETFHRALALGGSDAGLRARIEQNLGVLANIQGDLVAALGHYRRSLDAFRAGGDERNCAIVCNNLGLISADRSLWDDAEQYFRESLVCAEGVGDVHLRGLALLNRTEVFIARQR
ncbi:MAG: tetratricopeptide repeat protein, partial [Gemmatimonadota bacterium]|nr:tetratricopeptide repeat protein [Gemmatimonadota bacterium]